jgi:hypothetical protein
MHEPAGRANLMNAPRIQVDMFAVGLGAAILLQFEQGDAVVRVLADAGEAGYDVNARLPEAIKDFGRDDLRIDLLIGTHYDKDHLDGLVAIINNSAIKIGEAWLPPVANDTEPHTAQDTVQDANLLPLQLMGEDGAKVLRLYLNSKAELCDRLAIYERRADDIRGIKRRKQITPFSSFSESDWEKRGTLEDFFQAHIADAEQTIGTVIASHADEPITDPWEVTAELTKLAGKGGFAGPADIDELSKSWGAGRADRAAVEASTLGWIRRLAAKDAINAGSLAAVVKALRNRGIEIRCSTIVDGHARRFYWTPSKKRFSPLIASDSSKPNLLLLGPSNGLVEKYMDIIPIGTYASLAEKSLLPIRGTSASNQLSYIMSIEHANQRILICGDAGCNDFKPGGNAPYYTELIDALGPLHVVQVAHHGGNNAHFYRCLLAASKYREQTQLSYLLLSHAVDDKYHPNDVFSRFIEELGKGADEVQLLFSSRPLETRVHDVKPLIGKVVGTPGKSGDVRLQFYNAEWKVKKHAVSVS